MKIYKLVPHVIFLAFFIYEVFSFIQQNSNPDAVVTMWGGLVSFLQAGIIFFAIPAIYIGEAAAKIFDLEWGSNMLQLKLFYYFLYFLLIVFAGLELLDRIFS